ncbi:MAG TPA: hypothetical protein VFJ26_02175 [Dyella sp.]|uniref:hypothetical protein n=1 Tax=Dyella sp. TaxID=1869338 RepID=UPI002DA06528|nr:hypothetical protein [Dyella sp.]
MRRRNVSQLSKFLRRSLRRQQPGAYDRDDSFLMPASALKRRVQGRPMAAAEGRYRVA